MNTLDIYRGGGRPLHDVSCYRRVPLGSTPLCHAMQRHGSDKASGWHNYTPFYHHLLRGRALRRIFECGIGSVDPEIPYSMASQRAYYWPGASLRGWRDAYRSAVVFGADIDRAAVDAVAGEPGIMAYQVDQRDRDSVRWLWHRAAGDMDLIVDDGCHEFQANATLLEGSIHHLAEGGLYIIEDVKPETRTSWAAFLRLLPVRGIFVKIPGGGTTVGDNNLIVLERTE